MRPQALAGSAADAAAIPVAPCPSCEREVIAYPRPEHAGERAPRDAFDDAGEVHACTSCDRPLRGVRYVAEAELAGLGYEVRDPMAGGCATGCAAGGCGAAVDRRAALAARLKAD